MKKILLVAAMLITPSAMASVSCTDWMDAYEDGRKDTLANWVSDHLLEKYEPYYTAPGFTGMVYVYCDRSEYDTKRLAMVAAHTIASSEAGERPMVWPASTWDTPNQYCSELGELSTAIMTARQTGMDKNVMTNAISDHYATSPASHVEAALGLVNSAWDEPVWEEKYKEAAATGFAQKMESSCRLF